jgi:predicted alpha/beta hydrolase family esterase
MNRAIILHGIHSKREYYEIGVDSPSNSHWLPWLQQQLCRHDILAQTPEMPRPFIPNYGDWKDEFERLRPDDNTILIGHSCGGGFLVRWLSENPDRTVLKMVLVAPWLDIEKESFPLFDFSLRRDIAAQCKRGIDLLYSTNDNISMQLTLEHLRDKVDGLRCHEFVDYGHFRVSDMNTREFPELLQICLSE